MHAGEVDQLVGDVERHRNQPRFPRPLRVLAPTLTLDPVGGVELCTFQDSRALSERGHSIEVMYGHDGHMRAQYEAVGIGLTGPFSFGFDTRRALGDLRRFGNAPVKARGLRPDVLWLNRAEHLVWGQLVSRWARVPVVCHLHHLPASRWVRQLAVGVNQFIAVSEFIRQAWIESGLRPERVQVIHNAIQEEDYPYGGLEERLQARAKLGLPSDVPVILFYGRMSAEKGLPTLLQAYRHAGLTPDRALLLLVGNSWDEDEEFARQLAQLPDNAYRWFPSQTDVVPYLHAADVVAFPSLVQEAFGRVILEGMSTGRPVVASRVGAVPEIMSGSMSRFTVRPGSAEELGERLTSLLNWRRDTPDLGVKCNAWTRERFPYSAHVEALEDVLQNNRRRGKRA